MPFYGEKKRSFQREWIASRRLAWINSKGGKCFGCGALQNLEVDHINPYDKEIQPSKLWSLSDDNPKKILELSKCQVLCIVCHQEKTSAQRLAKCDTSHGSSWMYKHGKCRCKICRWGDTKARKARRDSNPRHLS